MLCAGGDEVGMSRLALDRSDVTVEPISPAAWMRVFLRNARLSGRSRWRLLLSKRPSVDPKHDGPLVRNDFRHGCDRQHTPMPDQDAVMTDHDSVVAGEFHKCPDALALPVKYCVSLRPPEQCS
jgi:hypothetical protein